MREKFKKREINLLIKRQWAMMKISQWLTQKWR